MQDQHYKEMTSNNVRSVLLGSSLANVVDFYWAAFLVFNNVLEDISGADGRREYLLSLRYKLVETLQRMDASLYEHDSSVNPGHELSFALQYGLRFFNMTGEMLVDALRFSDADISYEDLKACLLSFGETIIQNLPGEIPDALGHSGHRQILLAMRKWSKAANATGDNLDFLAARLRDI